jgi:acetyl esterase/lipase
VVMTWEQLYAQPARGGARKFSYGTDPLNYAELWLPAGGTASATVLMVHGGCWQTDIATCSIMQWAAHDLCTRGIAVWNIEYRGVDRSGGGYPGTFLDVATAADHLRDVAPAHGLRLDRVVAMGHSAGGHLALWLAGRPGLPRCSVLHRPDPLPIHAVIASGALPDLDAALRLPGNVCGSTGVPRLVGVPSHGRPDVYADTSATSLLPIPADVRLVYGARDEIAPTSLGRAFAACGTAVGQKVRLVEVAEEGHVELIVPGTAAWQAQLSELFAVLA